ncbi:MAG: hypothetical protein CL760_09710 [Chloroflexi bacterium]|nr:hypothetical protein [Chloroflexota bacterium]|tara:strand:+ start:9508 stop:9744 length:237 start_codon:yes stop_codon:yes gene_type:complete
MTTSFTVETAHLPENDDITVYLELLDKFSVEKFGKTADLMVDMFDTDIETEDILKGYFSNCIPIIEAINDIEKKSLSK